LLESRAEGKTLLVGLGRVTGFPVSRRGQPPESAPTT